MTALELIIPDWHNPASSGTLAVTFSVGLALRHEPRCYGNQLILDMKTNIGRAKKESPSVSAFVTGKVLLCDR